MLSISLEQNIKEVRAPKEYQDFISKLLQQFPEMKENKFSFSYKDQDGDNITVEEPQSYKEMLLQAQEKMLECQITIIGSSQEETSENDYSRCSERQSDDADNPTFREEAGDLQQSCEKQSLEESQRQNSVAGDSRDPQYALEKESQLISSDGGENELDGDNRSRSSERVSHQEQQNRSFASQQMSNVQLLKNPPAASKDESRPAQNQERNQIPQSQQAQISPQAAQLYPNNEQLHHNRESNPLQLVSSRSDPQNRRQHQFQLQSVQKANEQGQVITISVHQYQQLRRQRVLVQNLKRQLDLVSAQGRGICTFCEERARKYKVQFFKGVFMCEDCHNRIEIRVTAKHQMID